MAEKKKFTVEEIEGYYQKLLPLMGKDKELAMEENEDRAHNSMVVSAILEKSDHMKMFCGELSIFREDFTTKMAFRIENGLEGAKKIMTIFYKNLNSFLAKGHEIDIIFQKKSDTLAITMTDEIKKIFSKYKKSIKLYKLKKEEGEKYVNSEKENHFTIGGNHLRIEDDEEKHSALFIMNDDESLQIFEQRFQQLKSLSEEFDITHQLDGIA